LTSKKHPTRFQKICMDDCSSAPLTVTFYWASNIFIRDQKFVFASASINQNCSTCVGLWKKYWLSLLFIMHMIWISSQIWLFKGSTISSYRVKS